MANEPLSGKNGSLYFTGGVEITPVSNWRLNWDPNVHPYGANDTQGWQSAISGMHRSSGSFDVYVSVECNRPCSPGDILTAQFHVDDTGNNYFQLEVMIGPMDVNCEIGEDGAEVVYSFEWTGRSAVVPYGILAEGAGGSSGA
jgi:hypothetical protein